MVPRSPTPRRLTHGATFSHAMTDQTQRGASLPQVVFLAHGAQPEGPLIALMRTLDHWAQSQPGFRSTVVTAQPGPLIAEFGRAAEVVQARLDGGSPERRAQRVLSRLGHKRLASSVLSRSTAARLRSLKPDLLVVNGATEPTAHLLAMMDQSVPSIAMVHEHGTGWFQNITADQRSLLPRRNQRFLAVSASTARFLHTDLGVSHESIVVVGEPAGAHGRPPTTAPEVQGGLRERLGIAPDSAIVLGGGVPDFRKAPELWMRVASNIPADPSRPVHFVWFGDLGPEAQDSWPLRRERALLGVEGCVHFVGRTHRPDLLMDEADLFLHTAREDANPLVCLEAALAGLPVLTFDTGGAADLVRAADCGVVAAYPDTGPLAEAVATLLADPDHCREAGIRGRRFVERNSMAEHVAGRIQAEILDLLALPQRPVTT